MGPVADAVLRAGGSLERVFARAEMPLGLIDHPDRIIPLRDALAVIEHATREIGDETLPAWLSSGAGVAWLGPFGSYLQSAKSLREAIGWANGIIATGLQTGTEMRLDESGRTAYWTYRVTVGLSFGRQRNELLAFGYMIDLVRAFAGRTWRPDHVVVPGRLVARSAIERAIGTGSRDGVVAALVFPSELLDLSNPARSAGAELEPLPAPGDFLGVTAQLMRTSLLIENRERMEWVARRLGLSTRTLQRRLADTGTSFLAIRNAMVFEEACAMLSRGARATDVAYDLGYADPAHFSRAFHDWAGISPMRWRSRAQSSKLLQSQAKDSGSSR